MCQTYCWEYRSGQGRHSPGSQGAFNLGKEVGEWDEAQSIAYLDNKHQLPSCWETD